MENKEQGREKTIYHANNYPHYKQIYQKYGRPKLNKEKQLLMTSAADPFVFSGFIPETITTNQIKIILER